MAAASDNSKAALLIRLSCIAWLAAKFISWKLWMPVRLFPMIPVFDFIPQFPVGFHFVLGFLGIVAIVLAALFPSQRLAVASVITLETVSCIFDQMRWQPWEYQYLLTFIIFAFYSRAPRRFLESVGLLIGVSYIFSGLHKFSASFLSTVWDGMILQHFFKCMQGFIASATVHYSGLVLAALEVAIGFGLLFCKNKRVFVYSALAMHLFLLLVLGPFGLSFNEVVWPWNIVMMLLVWLLFSDADTVITRNFLKPVFNRCMIVLLVILPMLNFAGLWDNHLSFNLYSGAGVKLFVCTREKSAFPELQAYETAAVNCNYCDSESTITSLNKWALAELKVVIYPSKGAYVKLHRQWVTKFGRNSMFVVYDYPYAKTNAYQIH